MIFKLGLEALSILLAILQCFISFYKVKNFGKVSLTFYMTVLLKNMSIFLIGKWDVVHTKKATLGFHSKLKCPFAAQHFFAQIFSGNFRSNSSSFSKFLIQTTN